MLKEFRAFLLQTNGSALLERPDVLTAGRLGFKVATRYRVSQIVVSVDAENESTPGGQIRRGRFLYFTTGDGPTTPTGTIERLDLKTKRHTIWARGLTMPNGPTNSATTPKKIPSE